MGELAVAAVAFRHSPPLEQLHERPALCGGDGSPRCRPVLSRGGPRLRSTASGGTGELMSSSSAVQAGATVVQLAPRRRRRRGPTRAAGLVPASTRGGTSGGHFGGPTPLRPWQGDLDGHLRAPRQAGASRGRSPGAGDAVGAHPRPRRRQRPRVGAELGDLACPHDRGAVRPPMGGTGDRSCGGRSSHP